MQVLIKENTYTGLILIGLITILCGILYPQKITETKIVYLQPTDEQLLNFWFNPQQDKAALRKRICK